MSTILNENLLLAIPLAPLAGSLIAGLFGKAVGRAGAHSVTILGVAISFILSAIVFFDVLNGASFNATVYEWMSIGKTKFEVGFLVVHRHDDIDRRRVGGRQQRVDERQRCDLCGFCQIEVDERTHNRMASLRGGVPRFNLFQHRTGGLGCQTSMMRVCHSRSSCGAIRE